MEGLRTVFVLARQCAKSATKHALDRWLSWARRCRIPAFVALGRRVAAHHDAIHIGIDHGLSNGLVERVNTKLRLLTRMAFGYADPYVLIGLGMLALGSQCPPLPGRTSRR
jgi:transposase